MDTRDDEGNRSVDYSAANVAELVEVAKQNRIIIVGEMIDEYLEIQKH